MFVPDSKPVGDNWATVYLVRAWYLLKKNIKIRKNLVITFGNHFCDTLQSFEQHLLYVQVL